jgi:CBS domain containing-hemolysin-like protein
VGIVLAVALLILAIEFGIEGLILPHAEQWAVRFSTLGVIIDGLASPLSSLLMPLLGSPGMLRRRLSPVTEDELKNWVEEGQLDGNLEAGERKMIYSIFHFGDTLAREIMVPRIDITALDVTASLQEVIPVLVQSGHSRVPVYEGTIDNVIGMLYAKDLLRMLREGQRPVTIRDLLRPAYFIPEAKKVDDLLAEMRHRRVHMAIVVDEFGGVAGLVTLEDIVEEIVGEIRDEYDSMEEQPYIKVAEDEFVFQGRIDLDDFNEVMGCQLERDIADTLGGFVYNRMGHVPVEGETLVENGLHFTVEQVIGRRIRKIRARHWLAEELEKEDSHDSKDSTER